MTIKTTYYNNDIDNAGSSSKKEGTSRGGTIINGYNDDGNSSGVFVPRRKTPITTPLTTTTNPPHPQRVLMGEQQRRRPRHPPGKRWWWFRFQTLISCSIGLLVLIQWLGWTIQSQRHLSIIPPGTVQYSLTSFLSPATTATATSHERHLSSSSSFSLRPPQKQQQQQQKLQQQQAQRRLEPFSSSSATATAVASGFKSTTTKTTTTSGSSYSSPFLLFSTESPNNYFQRLWLGHDDGDDSSNSNNNNKNVLHRVKQLLPSYQVMEHYIQQHSQQQLQHEWISCQLQQQPEKNNTTNHYNSSTTTTVLSSCTALEQRNFMVGVYSCPLQSGNRLHRFMNAFVWAIATNRTLLWRYFTHDICRHEYNETADLCLGLEQSHPNDCNRILELASWVPAWDDWHGKLNVTSADIQRAQMYRNDMDVTTQPYDPIHKTHRMPTPPPPLPPRIIRPGLQFLPDPGTILSRLNTTKLSSSFLSQRSNWDRMYQLVQPYGGYFVYGMMFESLFTLRNEFWPSSTTMTDNNNNDDNDRTTTMRMSKSNSESQSHTTKEMEEETYFLHSRHPYNQFDGSYIWPEQVCLQKLLSSRILRNDTHNDTTTMTTTTTTNATTATTTTTTAAATTTTTTLRPCTIYLMSDRNLTIDLLTPIIQDEYHCRVQVANHTTTTTTTTNPSISATTTTKTRKRKAARIMPKEHGPFAGVGYWQDWALAIQARTGFISFHLQPRTFVRTSSSLMREVIEFRRVVEYLKEQVTITTTTTLRSDTTMTTALQEGQSPQLSFSLLPPPFRQCTNPWLAELEPTWTTTTT
jgi:hypothetical protein